MYLKAMTILPVSSTRPIIGSSRLTLGRVSAFVLLLAMSLAIIFGWNQLERLGAFGYPAVFLLSLLANAAFLLPAPSTALVVAAGGTLDPILVGLIAGLGAALGELTGYFIGQSGQTVLNDRPIYWRIEEWMKKSGSLVIFILAAVPNPLFDLGGLIAGALHMPIWRFVLSAWIGKSLRFALLAFFGALMF